MVQERDPKGLIWGPKWTKNMQPRERLHGPAAGPPVVCCDSSMKLSSPVRMVLTLHSGFQLSGWKEDMLQGSASHVSHKPSEGGSAWGCDRQTGSTAPCGCT